MTTISKHFIVINLAVVILLQSCSDRQSDSLCNCKGSLQYFDNINGVIVKSRPGDYIIISDKLGIVLPCTGLSDENKVDGQLVSFSGSYIPTCIDVQKGYGVNVTRVAITSISKVDILYSTPPLTINILHTEDYGRPIGFGYEIQYSKVENFVIRQLDIPGVGNNQTFKTASDAFKVAVLVGYKIELLKGFPIIQPGELFYLQIIDQLI